jgi:hypothetical protein
MDNWKRKLLNSDTQLTHNQINILLNGPTSLSEAWVMQSLRFKYNILKKKE